MNQRKKRFCNEIVIFNALKYCPKCGILNLLWQGKPLP